MRMLTTLLLAACTGTPPPAPPPEEPTVPEARPKLPPQGPPPPAEVVLAELDAWAGTRWTLSDGRSLTLDDGTATLGDEALTHALTKGGGRLGGRLIRLVTPCALAVYEGDTWVEAERSSPPCSAEEAAVQPEAHTTWAISGGDRYTFLPEGRAWRHGDKRSFKHPIGTWDAVEGRARFGETDFRVHPVGACHMALEIPKIHKLSRAHRTFPACTGGPYEDLPFSLWKTDENDLIDLHGPGAGQLDVFRNRGREVLQWRPTETGFQAQIAERTLEVSIEGCAATIREAGRPEVKAARTWPPCR